MCVQRDVCFVPWTDIEVACYGYEGIDAVKDALRAGLNCSTEAMPIKVRSTSLYPVLAASWAWVCDSKCALISFQINLIAPPRYVMTTTTLERTEGLSVLNQAMTAIKERIEEKRGVFNVQMEVRHFTFTKSHRRSSIFKEQTHADSFEFRHKD